MNIEPLEARIAPASVFNYVDVDGDKVKITCSANGPNIADNVFLFAAGAGNQCGGLDLGAAYTGANIIFIVTKVPGGDGLANVGYVDAPGLDLGNVTIKGDLASIFCGNGNAADGPALKTLNVRSMGRFGEATSGGLGGIESNIQGALNALVVAGDVKGVNFHTTGGIGSVIVKGSLLGGTTTSSGEIFSNSDIGAVTIGKDLRGGAGDGSGSIQSATKIKSVIVGGSVIGGGGLDSGIIAATSEVGPVRIARDLVGGSGYNSGAVALLALPGKIVSVTVGGSVVGGGDTFAGSIHASLAGQAGDGALGNVTVGGSLLGASAAGTGSIIASSALGFVKIKGDVDRGYIQSVTTTGGIAIGGSIIGGPTSGDGALVLGDVTGKLTIGRSIIGGTGSATGYINADHITSLSIGGDLVGSSVSGNASIAFAGVIKVLSAEKITIGGSVISGFRSGTGTLSQSGHIVADSIGALVIKGSLVGNETTPVTIQIDGKAPGDPGFALGSLTVGGRVEWARIAAAAGGAANVQIGTVKVTGDWIASTIASGVNPNGPFWGDGNDSLSPGNISRIAAITLGGAIIGSGAIASDSFAFTAKEIGSFKVFGKALPLLPNTPDFGTFSPETGSDVKLVEFS